MGLPGRQPERRRHGHPPGTARVEDGHGRADWQTNATTQVTWGLRYISAAYGTPCAAWAHSQANNFY